MANSVGNEHQPVSRTPARLVVSVLVLGTVLAWWGTRDDRRLFGESPRGPIFVSPPDSPRNVQSDTAMLARGYQIEQRECAGCHEATARSVGPSYREIVSFYRRQSTLPNGKPNLLSAIAAAVAHPQPGWANFAPGPSLSSMTLEDRITVASWLLNLGQKKGASEGPGK
jgi:cytochrome c551/c552